MKSENLKFNRKPKVITEFYKDVADLAGTSPDIAKKVINSLMIIGIEDIIESGQFKIPEIVAFKVRTLAATKGRYLKPKYNEGPIWVPAKPPRKAIKVMPLYPFKELSKTIDEILSKNDEQN